MRHMSRSTWEQKSRKCVQSSVWESMRGAQEEEKARSAALQLKTEESRQLKQQLADEREAVGAAKREAEQAAAAKLVLDAWEETLLREWQVGPAQNVAGLL